MKRQLCFMLMLGWMWIGSTEAANRNFLNHRFPLSDPKPPQYQTVQVFQNLKFNKPVHLTSPRDGTNRIFVVDQSGAIRWFYKKNPNRLNLFLKIPENRMHNGWETGLIGLAFDPDFKTNGEFYISYSRSKKEFLISRLRATNRGSSANFSSEQVLLRIPQPSDVHQAGALEFGPDGYLYIALGDGGGQSDPKGNGQNTRTHLGSILRIDPRNARDYRIPRDNPFVGRSNYLPEIWAYGFRNPWKISFDRLDFEQGNRSAKLWVGDVGQNTIEEINLVEAGGNYGWKILEGTRTHSRSRKVNLSSLKPPIYEYSHAVGWSVIGGYVYRGQELPALYGKYVYGDWQADKIWALEWNTSGKAVRNTQIAKLSKPVSFGEDEEGELYILQKTGSGMAGGGIQSLLGAPKKETGKIFQLVEKPSRIQRGSVPSKLSKTGLFRSLRPLVPANGLIPYEVNSPLYSDNAIKKRWIYVPPGKKVQFKDQGNWNFPTGTLLVKHFALSLSGGKETPIETRIFFRHTGGWKPYVYLWKGQDADLHQRGKTIDYTKSDGTRAQWTVPGSNQCFQCHTSVSNLVLGVRTGQINRIGPDTHINQLVRWSELNLIDRRIRDPEKYVRFEDPLDEEKELEPRVRSYLESNCAHCHQPGGPTQNIQLDFRYSSSLERTGMINQKPKMGSLGLNSPLQVFPGHPERSMIYHRMSIRGEKQMPFLGTHLQDEKGLKLFERWIHSLK